MHLIIIIIITLLGGASDVGRHCVSLRLCVHHKSKSFIETAGRIELTFGTESRHCLSYTCVVSEFRYLQK